MSTVRELSEVDRLVLRRALEIVGDPGPAAASTGNVGTRQSE